MQIRKAGTGWRNVARSLGLVLVVLALTVGAALASDGHGGGGLPQLNPATFPTQLFWLVVTFVTLYFLLFGVALPKVEETLEARDSRIAWDITKADELKNESNQVLAAVEQQIAEARVQAQEILSRTSGEGDSAAKVLLGKFEAELNTRTKAAEERINAAKSAALAQLNQSVTPLVHEIATRVAGTEIELAKVKKAVETAIKEQA